MLVKIKGTVITSQYGALSDGTLLRTSDAFAKHLVEEAFAAEYVTNTEAPIQEAETTEIVAKKRTKQEK